MQNFENAKTKAHVIRKIFKNNHMKVLFVNKNKNNINFFNISNSVNGNELIKINNFFK